MVIQDAACTGRTSRMAEGLETEGQRGEDSGDLHLEDHLLLGELVEWTPTAKYIGVTINRKLSMQPLGDNYPIIIKKCSYLDNLGPCPYRYFALQLHCAAPRDTTS